MSDHNDGTSPYREGGGGLPCARCQSPMLSTAGREMACSANGCGYWWSKSDLAATLDWRAVETAEPYRVFGVAGPELPCPECASAMIVSLRAEVEFAHCDAHGLWLDRRERGQTFDQLGGWPGVLCHRVQLSS